MDPSVPNKNRKQNSRRRRPNNKNNRPQERLPPAPRTAGPIFRTTHKMSSSSLSVSLIPNSGISIAGLTTGYVAGLVFFLNGFGIYQPSVGLGTVVTVTYPNYNNYFGIFDQGRIRRVTVHAYFSNNSSSVNSVTNNIPLLYSAVDYDASSNPTTQGAVLGYHNSKVIQANTMSKPCVNESFVPRAINDLTSGLLSGSYAALAPAGTWIDTATGTCPHYGCFVAYDPQGATQNTTEGQLTFVVTLDLEFCGNH